MADIYGLAAQGNRIGDNTFRKGIWQWVTSADLDHGRIAHALWFLIGGHAMKVRQTFFFDVSACVSWSFQRGTIFNGTQRRRASLGGLVEFPGRRDWEGELQRCAISGNFREDLVLLILGPRVGH